MPASARPTIRLDVSYGDGVYKSTDAGRTWSHIGLKETKFIGGIVVHPTDPDLVYVAALGDVFGPNKERGVYRSKDGGKTWQKVFYRSDVAGAVEISMDRNNPRILFAAVWEAKRNFWNISSGGPGSGLFRSKDGGDTWEEVSGKTGFPERPLGKIGVAVSPVKAGRVWALVEAEGDKTGLYRSDDYGERWVAMSHNRDLMHRPWYYTHVFADTGHADTVFVTNLQMWKSTDGGTNFSEVTTRHGDNHDLWIDPNDASRMIEGNDGGANVSLQRRRVVVDDLQPEDRRSSTASTSTTSTPTASTAPSRTTPRSRCRAPRNGASSRWPTAPIPGPAKAASSPSIRAITTSSISAPSARARAAPARCSATTIARARSSS